MQGGQSCRDHGPWPGPGAVSLIFPPHPHPKLVPIPESLLTYPRVCSSAYPWAREVGEGFDTQGWAAPKPLWKVHVGQTDLLGGPRPPAVWEEGSQRAGMPVSRG